MDYEKKYKEALERMESWARGEHPECFTEAQRAAEFIFPELAESEDERIRKDLIAIFKGEIPFTSEEDAKRYIAWLEKQGEQKPYGQREECLDCQFNYAGECKGFCQMKINEQKSTWSEEDEVMIEETLYFLREYQQSNRCKDENGMQNSVSCEKWLKSLKERIGG